MSVHVVHIALVSPCPQTPPMRVRLSGALGDVTRLLQGWDVGSVEVVLETDDGDAALQAGLQSPGPRSAVKPRRMACEAGAPIPLGDDEVLCVRTGIVATTTIHADGTEVLLALAGPGDIVIGHPEDSCSLHLRAHVIADVDVLTWHEARQALDLPVCLRMRIRQAEGWAAAQARPRLDDRVTGLLSELAPRFGRSHDGGTLIDVRLTHGHLAAALGATRATMTRVIGRLKRRKAVLVIGEGDQQRFVVRHVEHHDHR
jgi:CRP-like cAMP-binding protein